MYLPDVDTETARVDSKSYLCLFLYTFPVNKHSRAFLKSDWDAVPPIPSSWLPRHGLAWHGMAWHGNPRIEIYLFYWSSTLPFPTGSRQFTTLKIK